jgi:putative ABC transport system permease protein
MRELLQDLRHGLRTLRKHPGFAVAAVLALGIGTGVNTAVFTVVNGVLLRPLAYGDPQALVFVWASNPKTNRLRDPISVPDLVDYRSQSSSLENIASFVYDDFNLSTAGEPARVQGTMVSANFFATLGVVPRLGRAFSDEEERSSAERVVVISDGLWKRRFGADPGIIDRTVQLNGATFTVVGVTGPDFRSPEKGDELWIPMCFDGGDRIRVPSSSSRPVPSKPHRPSC